MDLLSFYEFLKKHIEFKMLCKIMFLCFIVQMQWRYEVWHMTHFCHDFLHSLVMELRLDPACFRKELLNNCIVHASWCLFTLITKFQWSFWMVIWIRLDTRRTQRHEIRPSEHISSVYSLHISFRSMLQIHTIQFIHKCQVSAHKISIKRRVDQIN